MNHTLSQSKIQGSKLRVREIRDLGFESFPACFWFEQVVHLEKQQSCLPQISVLLILFKESRNITKDGEAIPI